MQQQGNKRGKQLEHVSKVMRETWLEFKELTICVIQTCQVAVNHNLSKVASEVGDVIGIGHCAFDNLSHELVMCRVEECF